MNKNAAGRIFGSTTAIALYILIGFLLITSYLHNSKIPQCVVKGDSFTIEGATFTKSNESQWIMIQSGESVARVSSGHFSIKSLFMPEYIYCVGDPKTARFMVCTPPGSNTTSLFVREGVNLPSVSNAKFDKAELYIAKSKNDIKKYFNSDPAVISDFVKLNQEAHAKKDDSGTLSASFSRSGTDYVVHLYSSEFPEIYVYAGTMFYAENGAMGMLCPDLSITKFVLIPVPDNVTSDLTSLQNGTLVGKWTNSSSQQ